MNAPFPPPGVREKLTEVFAQTVSFGAIVLAKVIGVAETLPVTGTSPLDAHPVTFV